MRVYMGEGRRDRERTDIDREKRAQMCSSSDGALEGHRG